MYEDEVRTFIMQKLIKNPGMTGYSIGHDVAWLTRGLYHTVSLLKQMTDEGILTRKEDTENHIFYYWVNGRVAVQGTRRDYDDDSIPDAGEYGRDSIGQWYCVPPNQPELLANLSNHQVAEHEDGTITVRPSILVTLTHRGLQWHGYLERGVFREV